MKGVNMNLSFNTEKIYEDACFLVQKEDKVGVVGVNGAGKTTLFKVLLKEQNLDSGFIEYPKNTRIGYLPQEIVLENEDILVIDYLLEGRPIRKLENEITSLYEKVSLSQDCVYQNRLLKEIGKKQDLLEYFDVYQAENILLDLVEKMQIPFDLLDQKLKDLSGGEKSKMAFARLLYSNPEIILLDEPTNHLDTKTREYVISYLKNYKGMVLVISHDVSFLDEVTNKTLFLDKITKKMRVFEGNYSVFQKKREKETEIKERLIEKQEKEEQHLRDFILQYSNSSGKRKRIAQSREKLLEKKLKEKVARDATSKTVKFQMFPNREGSRIPVKVNNITFGYGEEKLFSNLSFLINNKERFLIMGQNGVGKSTLLKLIVGSLQVLEGSIWMGNKTDIAYYAQEQENLALDKTILENVDSKEYNEKSLRSALGSFLFHGDDVFKKVGVLSPGEKARVALCKILLKRANFLILDEPTNHLDPETQRIIGQNFRDYGGTILLVSHNISFIKEIGIDRVLLLPSGKVCNYDPALLEHYCDTFKG